MILQILAVFDLKAHSFANPVFMAHEDLGKRAFEEAAKSPGNSINKHPADYQLYHLGKFDDSSAEFSIFPQPKLLFAGSQLPQFNEMITHKDVSHVR